LGSIHKLAEHYRKGIAEQGHYDFIGVGLGVDQDFEIDIFLYDLGSDSGHIVGVYEEDFEGKKDASKTWMDYFADNGLDVSRSLRSIDSLSDGLMPEKGFEQVYWSQNLPENDVERMLSRLGVFFDDDLEVYKKLA